MYVYIYIYRRLWTYRYIRMYTSCACVFMHSVHVHQHLCKGVYIYTSYTRTYMIPAGTVSTLSFNPPALRFHPSPPLPRGCLWQQSHRSSQLGGGGAAILVTVVFFGGVLPPAPRHGVGCLGVGGGGGGGWGGGGGGTGICTYVKVFTLVKSVCSNLMHLRPRQIDPIPSTLNLKQSIKPKTATEPRIEPV